MSLDLNSLHSSYLESISNKSGLFGDDCSLLCSRLALSDLLDDLSQFQIRHISLSETNNYRMLIYTSLSNID